MEFQDPFGWHSVTGTKFHYIRDKLAHYETMTWSEILGPQNHQIPRANLCHDAQVRLRELKQDDIDSLLSLHLSARERVFGILEGSVLRILWWDPEHGVCPSRKRHT
jgi:hypothetical protein